MHIVSLGMPVKGLHGLFRATFLLGSGEELLLYVNIDRRKLTRASRKGHHLRQANFDEIAPPNKSTGS